MSSTTTNVTTQKKRIFCVLLKSPVFSKGCLTGEVAGGSGACTLAGAGVGAGVIDGIKDFGAACCGAEGRAVSGALDGAPFCEGAWDALGTMGGLAVLIPGLRSGPDACGWNGV